MKDHRRNFGRRCSCSCPERRFVEQLLDELGVVKHAPVVLGRDERGSVVSTRITAIAIAPTIPRATPLSASPTEPAFIPARCPAHLQVHAVSLLRLRARAQT